MTYFIKLPEMTPHNLKSETASVDVLHLVTFLDNNFRAITQG